MPYFCKNDRNVKCLNVLYIHLSWVGHEVGWHLFRLVWCYFMEVKVVMIENISVKFNIAVVMTVYSIQLVTIIRVKELLMVGEKTM